MNISRVLNMQSYLHQNYGELQSAYTVVIAQHAEVVLIACAVDHVDPYEEILEAVQNMLGAMMTRADYALMAIGVMAADAVYMEAHR